MTHNHYNLIDSEIKWVGMIPSHWTISKFKHEFTFSKSTNTSKNPTILSLTLQGIKIRDISTNEGQIASSYDNYTKVYKNDIVLNPMDLISGFVDCSPVEGVISPAYYTLKPNKDINPEYYKYYLQKHYYEKIFFPFAEGVSVDHRWTLKKEDFLNFSLIKPPLEEQNQIAKYLNEKTSKIDESINKNKQLIELLHEKRDSLINQIVTKGLDPNVKMKDSGIKWIGQIPEHWTIQPLKYVTNIIMGQSPNSDDINNEKQGILFMQGNAEFTALYPQPSEYCSAPKKISREGDILMSVRAPVGEINISDKRYGIGRGLCSIKAIKIKSKFLWYYLMKSKVDFNYYSNGSTFDAITIGNLSSFPITVPKLEEQIQITDYLDKITFKIDKAIEKIQDNITLLEEYKTSLIHHVVTGKIDVNDEV